MKIETKRKILWYVKRILNYCECADGHYIVVEKGKILPIRSEHGYPNHEMDMIDEHQIHYTSNMALMSEHEKFIKYEKRKEGDTTRVVATLNILVK